MLGVLLVATPAAVAAVLLAPVDSATLAAVGGVQPPPNAALGGHAFLWAVVLNSAGTIALVGGSLLSILRRQRVRANVWIASGALCVAAATGLSRAGDTSLVYVGELVGLALMFCGFTLPAPRVGRSGSTPRSGGGAMRRAFHEHANAVVAHELRRVPEEQRASIALVCAAGHRSGRRGRPRGCPRGAAAGRRARLHLRIG